METIINNSTLKNLRVTGILFLLCLALPTLNWVFVFSHFMSLGSILEKEVLFRFNIINQLISAICVILLGYFLHLSLKQINNRLSLLSFVVKNFEAGLTLVLALFYLIVFLLFKAELVEISAFKEMVGNYISYTAFPGIFLGVSMLLFSILFYKSAFIPNWLAVLGVISYVFVILYDGSVVLFSETFRFIQIIGSVPVCLFQVITGFYLIFSKPLKFKIQ